LVVGSGYGAAMATLALLESAASPPLWVFERGREYLPDDFPSTMGDAPGFIGSGAFNNTALWDIRPGENVVTVSGRALGGTSLVNANVAMRPPDDAFETWPQDEREDMPAWPQRLAACFDKLEALLGVSRPDSEHLAMSGAEALKRTAACLGAEAEA